MAPVDLQSGVRRAMPVRQNHDHPFGSGRSGPQGKGRLMTTELMPSCVMRRMASVALIMLACGGSASWGQSSDGKVTVRPLDGERKTIDAAPALELQVDDAPVAAMRPFEDGPIPVSQLPTRVPGLAHEIAADAAVGRLSLLVHLDPAQDAVAQAVNPVRAQLRDFVLRTGGRVKHEYLDVLPNVVNVRGVPAKAVEALKRLPGVVKVEEDTYDIRIALHDSVPRMEALQHQLGSAGVPVDGSGVRVCVVDTGIDSDHVMYAGRIDAAAGYDFANDDSNPEDDNSHGSHVAGIAVGGTGLTVDFGCVGPEPFQGVAPNATLIGVKALNSWGGGFDSDVIAGINRCASATLPGGRADVINLSLGAANFTANCDSHIWAQAANNAANAGVVVVAASGNECRTNALRSPACASKVIAVGATYDDNFPSCENSTTNFWWSCCIDSQPQADQIVCFSNGAPFIDVSAPGSVIWSASFAAGGTSITAKSGASMAAPHVTGLVALLLDMDPTLTPAEVQQLIQQGAVDLGPVGFDSRFGWGRVNAVNSLRLIAPPCADDADCDDGLFCNGLELCSGGFCQPGTPVNCGDGVACTVDACDEGSNSCTHVPSTAACDDGLFCNGAEACHATLGCRPGVDPCAGDTCNESTDTCGAGPEVWLVFYDTTTIPGVGAVENEDIVSYSPDTGTWSMVFDGSDVGLAMFAIDGFALLPSGEFLLTFNTGGSVAGLSGGPSGTTIDDSDVVRFIPTSLGSSTAGSFTFYFDGSDVGLTTNDEDIDALGLDAAGRLVISTVGNVSATGASGADEDLLVFTATSLGATTTGSFAVLFDGGDVGLTANDEDVDAAGFTSSGALLLSTIGNLSVTGASGADEDLFLFQPSQLGSTTSGTFSLFLDLSTLGIDPSEDVVAAEVIE